MEKLNFSTAFKYPFKRPLGLWNILWVLVPIIGWLAVAGYIIRIIQGFIRGEFERLPEFTFSKNLELGFFMLIKSIPFGLVYAIVATILIKIDSSLTFIIFLFQVIALPILTMNFIHKETVSSYFEFEIIMSVFNNIEDYVVVLFKSILLAIIFVVMSLILVGIPAMAFTYYIFVADFYRRRVMQNIDITVEQQPVSQPNL
jgi:hypothetical protein